MTLSGIFRAAGFAGAILFTNFVRSRWPKSKKGALVKKVPCVKCDAEMQTDRSFLQDHWEELRPRYRFKSRSTIDAENAAHKMATTAIETVVAADAARKMATTAIETVVAADATRKIDTPVVVKEVCDEVTVSELIQTLEGPKKDAVERIYDVSLCAFGLLEMCTDLYMKTCDDIIKRYAVDCIEHYEHAYTACIIMIDRVLADHPLCRLDSMILTVARFCEKREILPLFSDESDIFVRNLNDMRKCLDYMYDEGLSYPYPVSTWSLSKMQRDYCYLADEVDALGGFITIPIDAPSSSSLSSLSSNSNRKTRRGCRGHRSNKPLRGTAAEYVIGTAASCYWINRGRM